MSFIKVVTFYLFLVVIGIGCRTTLGKELGNEPRNALLIDKDFQAININRFLLLNTQLKTKDLVKKNLKELILQNSSSVNPIGSLVMVGEYHQYPDAWFYTQIINTSNTLIDLVVSEENHLRCDGLEVISFRSDSLTHWGKLTRTTPFSERQISFYSYAIPISLSPKDTLNLLIHTQRKYGFHEVNLVLSNRENYLQNTIFQTLLKIAEIIVLALCILVMFIIGWLFYQRTMLLLGIYFSFGLFSLLSFSGFIDTISIFPNVGLNQSGYIPFGIFLLNAAYHPYGMWQMKEVTKNEIYFKFISYSFITINLLLAGCFFLPSQIFQRFDKLFPVLMAIMGSLNVVWMLYSSIIAYLRANIKHFLLAISIAYVPFLYEQFINVFFDSVSPLFLKINQTSFILAVIAASIISVIQLRERLITRKLHEENLNKLKTTLEQINQNEVRAIGRNLHDNVGNILASVLGHLNLKTLNKQNVQNLIKEAIAELRFLSHNLVKNDDLPLTDKITKLTDNFDEFSSIRFIFSDYSKGALDKLSMIQQTNLYYMVHELFSNALKHSNAHEVVLQVFEDKNRVWLSVEDDGIGMNSEGSLSGIGLRNINTRAKLSGFAINIDSSEKGTNTTIEISS